VHEPVFLLPLPPFWHMPIVALGLKAAGVKLIEVGGWDVAFDYTRQDHLHRLRDLLAEQDVSVYSYHPLFGGRYDFSHIDKAQRAEAVRLNVEQLRAAESLGAKYVVIHPSDHIDEGEHALRLSNSARGLRELAIAAEDIGVGLAIENLPPEYLAADMDELMLLVEGCESKRVGVCFDTGHANLLHLPMDKCLQKIGDRLFTIHWHDNDGSSDQHWLPGAGGIDWAGFFAGLGELGWDRPICLESGPPGDWSYTDFVAHVRDALAQQRPVL